MIPKHLPMSIVREIEKLDRKVAQTFVYQSDRGWRATLETTHNALVNSPNVYLGEFEKKEDAYEMARMAFDYAFKFQNKGRVETMAHDLKTDPSFIGKRYPRAKRDLSTQDIAKLDVLYKKLNRMERGDEFDEVQSEIDKLLGEAKEMEIELKSQELPSVASGDQNQITGLNIAAGRIQWMQDGEKKSDIGYIFKKNHGFAFKIDDSKLAQYSITMEALLDCVQQLEKMGTPAEVKAAMGYKDGQGPINNGLVIVSKVDPRIKMSVTPTSSDNEEVDFWVGWFLDNENLDHEMKVTNPKYEPEHTVDAEELKATDRAREENPVLNQTEEEADFTAEDLLGLTEGINPTRELVRSDKKSYLKEDTGLDAEPSEYSQIGETGEPDQDYDKGAYNAIVKALAKKGYKATHREFDKYQGIYLDVSKGGKKTRLWTIEQYVTGKTKPPKAEYRSATLRDDEGEYSATPGDYFQYPANHVFKNTDLVLTKHDGTEKVIKNPKKSDLVDTDGYIEYEGNPDEVLVFQAEGSGEDGPTAEVKLSHDFKNVDIDELLSLLGGSTGESKNSEEDMSNYKDMSEDCGKVDFWGVPLAEESEGTPMGKNIGPAGKKVGTGLDEKPAKKPVYAKDVKQFDKEIDKRDDASLGKGKDEKPVPVEAGKALEKPHSEEGDEYGEKDGGNKNQLGDPKSGVGDHMQGKGSSNDQQTDVPKNKVKPGAVDSKPKVVGEAEEGEKKKEKDLEAYTEGYHAAAKEMSEWMKGKKSMEEMDKMALDPEKKKGMESKGLDYMEGYTEAMDHMKLKMKECDMGGMKDKPATMPSDDKPAAESKGEMDDEEKKAMDKAKKTESKRLSIPEWAKKKRG